MPERRFLNTYAPIALFGLADALLWTLMDTSSLVEWDELSWRSVVWMAAALSGSVGLQFFLALDRSERLRRERPGTLLAAALLFWALPIATGPHLPLAAGLPLACALVLYRGRRRWLLALLLPAAELLARWHAWPTDALDDSLPGTLVEGGADVLWTALPITLFTAAALKSRHPDRQGLISPPLLWLLPVLLPAALQLALYTSEAGESSRRVLAFFLVMTALPPAVMIKLVFAAPRKAWPTLTVTALAAALVAYSQESPIVLIISADALLAIFSTAALLLLPLRKALPLLLAAVLAQTLLFTPPGLPTDPLDALFTLSLCLGHPSASLYLWAAAYLSTRTSSAPSPSRPRE
ncbi:hypothetical protein GCM10027589_23200 [Actinocorallia lasiicapitis]